MIATRGIDVFNPALARVEAALGDLPDALAALRRGALERLDAFGLPEPKEEAWRFTDPRPLTRLEYGEVKQPFELPREAERAVMLPWLPSDSPRLALVNGLLRSELSSQLTTEEHGAAAGSLAAAAQAEPEQVAALLERHAAGEGTPEWRNGFTALNTALFADGAYVHVAAGAELTEPITLLLLARQAGRRPLACYPRVLVVAERGSRATLVEAHPQPGGVTFTDQVSEVWVGPGARVDYVRILEAAPAGFHIASLRVHLQRDAAFVLHTVQRGGALVRTDVSVVLDGEGAECSLMGAYLSDGQERLDNHTWVDHARPRGTSRQLYKGIAAGRSRVVFDGQVLVREGAQKTSARQKNQNLVLGGDALVHSNPRLRIHADDVQCAHGSSLGQLDADALFYLRSRGLPAQRARELLASGFLREPLEGLAPQLREGMTAFVRERMLPRVREASQ